MRARAQGDEEGAGDAADAAGGLRVRPAHRLDHRQRGRVRGRGVRRRPGHHARVQAEPQGARARGDADHVLDPGHRDARRLGQEPGRGDRLPGGHRDPGGQVDALVDGHADDTGPAAGLPLAAGAGQGGGGAGPQQDALLVHVAAALRGASPGEGRPGRGPQQPPREAGGV